ncbi:MAG: molecular chaperone TorD family protein [Streptosporangiaceae bacterium]
MPLDRWELLRMLGAAAGDPGAARAAGAALGLPPCGDTEHAEVFAVNCPPYASVYLGAASTGRLAAFWAAAGLGVPPEPDHLTTLLGLYARLGAAAPEPGQLRPAHLRPAQLRPAQLRHTLFREYLWPWLPAFLGAVSDLPAGAMTPWAELTLCALRREREVDGGWDGPLPLALRQAPPAGADGGPGELLDWLTTPLRSGIILTRRAVAAGADRVGAGQRIGNGRQALGVMLAAEPKRTADWLADEADRWSRRHLAMVPGTPGDRVQQWWADRAARTARVLRAGYPAIAGVTVAG